MKEEIKLHPGAMVKCTGHGSCVEPYDVVGQVVVLSEYFAECASCKYCVETPALAEAYRRGFDSGVSHAREAMREFTETLYGVKLRH